MLGATFTVVALPHLRRHPPKVTIALGAVGLMISLAVGGLILMRPSVVMYSPVIYVTMAVASSFAGALVAMSAIGIVSGTMRAITHRRQYRRSADRTLRRVPRGVRFGRGREDSARCSLPRTAGNFHESEDGPDRLRASAFTLPFFGQRLRCLFEGAGSRDHF